MNVNKRFVNDVSFLLFLFCTFRLQKTNAAFLGISRCLHTAYTPCNDNINRYIGAKGMLCLSKVNESTGFSSELITESSTHVTTRRKLIATATSMLATALILNPSVVYSAVSSESSLSDLLPLVQKAKAQLSEVPSLIKNEKWDSVRAILITPPINDCWSKNSATLKNLAEAIGTEVPEGDELAALEAREEVVSHLRYLDMAVYNNIFNPIKSEGTNGASKALIESYYEDPMREYSASLKSLDEIIQLAGGKL